MKTIKIITIGLMIIAIIFSTYMVSKSIVHDKNSHHVPENPVITQEKRKEQSFPTDINKMMSHSLHGAGERSLPIKYKQNFTIYKNTFYVTNNNGKSWLQVPDDNALGYARISDYVDMISKSNIFASSNKISVVYGGRGSENISIISTENQGKLWSVASISKTATHDLQNGYDQLFIDLLDHGKTGYIVAKKDKILAFRSVNSGVTWDPIDKNDSLYNKILRHFGL